MLDQGCQEIRVASTSKGSSYGPLASLKRSELWAPVLKLVDDGVLVGWKDSEVGAHTRGP